ncbi:hypothetical protein [Neorhizobium sp. DT-125]|uniref:hypothetical protein n=1 Tax=Neorhizobium sp. DT-125 TaxID=3396163 RepID=UPI003F1D732A
MTSISATEPAALLILQQPAAQAAATAEEGKEQETKPDLVKVANGISGEPSKEAVKAAFAVSLAFVEMDAKSQLAADAAEFIDSDKFAVSDPTVKDTLKALIAEKGWEFMQMVKQQQEAHGGIGKEDLYALVLTQMVARNRERFTDDEFEMAFKFKDRPGLVIFVPDSEGNSTYRELTKALSDEENFAHKTGDDTALNEVRSAFAEYKSAWTTAFSFSDPPMFLDIDNVKYSPWMKK